MRVSVIIFPGSNCDMDAIHAFRNVLGAEVTPVWHKDHDLNKPDLVFIPGGFSYGDYLRSGAIARLSPVMSSVQAFYNKGGHVFGVCNGFQILCEMGILPGALLTNKDLKFLCQDVHIRIENTDTPFTAELTKGHVLNIPIAHGMGQYFADEATVDQLEDEDRVMFRYVGPDGNLDDAANPNGSIRSIAGICDAERRAIGMMPHPERHVESELGCDDGRILLACITNHFGTTV